MRSANTDLVVNGRHYTILTIDRFNAAEGWDFYQVLDTQTQFQFRVSEFQGADTLLETGQRRAEKLARLKIPGLPMVYDIFLEKGKLFVFTDSIKGYTLREYLETRNGPAKDDVAAMVEYGRRLCAILSRLHPNFVHRALRPENILLSGNRVLLTDLGFTFMPSKFETEKLLYRAPEQTLEGSGETIGCQTDIYGFGVIFGEMLTGNCLDFANHDTAESFHGWGQDAQRSNAWYEIPGELKDIVIHCTQTLPSYRPKNIEDVKRKLSEWLLFRKGELMGITNNSTRHLSPVDGHSLSAAPNLPDPLKSPSERYCPACGSSPGDRNNGSFEQVATSEDREESVLDSWFSRIGPILGSFNVKAMLRISLFVDRRDPKVKQYTDSDEQKHGRQRVNFFGIKRGFWVLIFLFLLLQSFLLKQINSPTAPVIWKPAVVKLEPGVERQELLDSLSIKLQDFNSLIAAYQNAKIPGSSEKTAQNFRYVESSAKALRQSMLHVSSADEELAVVITMEMEMFDTLKNAAGIFADYLEGKRKSNGSIDWVEEADIHYWKAKEIQAQVAGKLDYFKSQP